MSRTIPTDSLRSDFTLHAHYTVLGYNSAQEQLMAGHLIYKLAETLGTPDPASRRAHDDEFVPRIFENDGLRQTYKDLSVLGDILKNQRRILEIIGGNTRYHLPTLGRLSGLSQRFGTDEQRQALTDAITKLEAVLSRDVYYYIQFQRTGSGPAVDEQPVDPGVSPR